MKSNNIRLRGKLYTCDKGELIPQSKEITFDKDREKPRDISVKEVDTTLEVATSNEIDRTQYSYDYKNYKHVSKKPSKNKTSIQEEIIYKEAVDKDTDTENNGTDDYIFRRPERKEIKTGKIDSGSNTNQASSQYKYIGYKPNDLKVESNEKSNETDKDLPSGRNKTTYVTRVYVNRKYINNHFIHPQISKREKDKEGKFDVTNKIINKTQNIIESNAENDAGAATYQTMFRLVRGTEIGLSIYNDIKDIKRDNKRVNNIKTSKGLGGKTKNNNIYDNGIRSASKPKLNTKLAKLGKPNRTSINIDLKNKAKRFDDVSKNVSRDIALKTADVMETSDDIGLNSISTGINTVYYTGSTTGKILDHIDNKMYEKNMKSIQASSNEIKTFVKNSISTSVDKNVLSTGKLIIKGKKNEEKKQSYGEIKIKRYRAKWERSARKKIKTAVIKSGGSVVSATFSMLKTTAIKVAVPIAIVVIFILFFINLISSVGVATASIFSPFMSDKSGKEINETEWLENKINDSRDNLINQIKKMYDDNKKENGGKYDYIRFSTSFSNINDSTLTKDNIDKSIYSTKKYIQLIQPVFHVMMLTKYELNADNNEMEEVYKDIWNNINNITTEVLNDEYCEDGVVDGDGMIHADLDNCPNHTEIQHHDINSTQLSTCDIPTYVCNGHKENILVCGKQEGTTESKTLICTKIEHKHSPECFTSLGAFLIKNCGYEEHKHDDTCYLTVIENHKHEEWQSQDNPGCYSTRYCTPTKIMNQPCTNSTYTISCKGYAQCLGHKIFKINIIQTSFEDILYRYFGKDIEELESKDQLTTEERLKLNELKDNYEICSEYIKVISEEMGINLDDVLSYDDSTLDEITKLACSYIGNPYVYGGTDINNGIDCSAFVQYIYGQFGTSLPRTSREQVKCGQEISNINEAKPGDLIFYASDDNQDGVLSDNEVYHVAIYIGESKIVHASNEAPYPQGGIKISYVGTPYKIKRL